MKCIRRKQYKIDDDNSIEEEIKERGALGN